MNYKDVANYLKRERDKKPTKAEYGIVGGSTLLGSLAEGRRMGTKAFWDTLNATRKELRPITPLAGVANYWDAGNLNSVKQLNTIETAASKLAEKAVPANRFVGNVYGAAGGALAGIIAVLLKRKLQERK